MSNPERLPNIYLTNASIFSYSKSILLILQNYMAKAVKKAHNPHESIIIQAGVLFIVISAIVITAYAFANFYPQVAMGAGY